MHVRDENFCFAVEAYFRLNHLFLCALAAVKKEQFALALNSHGGKSPRRGGDARSGSQKRDL
jgi:hypothetical protein